MARKYTPAWQRTLLTALNNAPNASDGQSAWDSLPPEEQSAVKRFLADRAKGDQDKADAMLRETLPLVKPAKELGWLWLIGVLAVCILGGMVLAALTENVFDAKARAAMYTVGFGISLISNFAGAKGSRMRRIWTKRTEGEDGAYAALKRMFATSLSTPLVALKDPVTLLSLVMFVLCLVLLIRPAPPTAMYVRVTDVLVDVAKGEADMDDVLALIAPLDADNADQVIRKAYKNTWNNSDERYLAAALAVRMGHEKAAEYAKAAVTDTSYADLNTPAESAEFPALVALCDGETHHIALRTLATTGSREWEALLTALGAEMGKTRSAAELLQLLDETPMAEGRNVVFLQAALPGMSFAEAEGVIDGVDAAHRPLLIRAIASSFTAPDDVLAFIRLAKTHGLSASECYPDGALLTWDASAYDPYDSPKADGLGKRDTFLIIRRTEQPEPFTTFVVPEEQETSDGEALPTLYGNYDPDESLGAGQYTLVLETSALDRMPEERIPRTFAECDALVFLDTWYWCDGYVRFSRSVWKDDAWKYRQIDEPTFGMTQEIAVYSMANASWLFSYRDNHAYSPAMLEENLGGKDVLEWNTADYYIASPDEAWMAEAYADFLFALERRNWLLVP